MAGVFFLKVMEVRVIEEVSRWDSKRRRREVMVGQEDVNEREGMYSLGRELVLV